MENNKKIVRLNDGYGYDYLYEIINDCLGKDLKGWQQATYPIVKGQIIFWFPQLAVIKDGKETAQSITKDWINTLSDDGMTIVSKSEEYEVKNPRSELHVTFAKEKGDKYRFIGVYRRNKEKTTSNYRVSERIFDEFDFGKIYSYIDYRELPYDEIRDTYRGYLNDYTELSKATVDTAYTDTFYLWDKTSKESFWKLVDDEDFESHAGDILKSILSENFKGKVDNLFNGYVSHLRRFRNFIIDNSQTYSKDSLIEYIEKFENLSVKKFNGINKYHIKYNDSGIAVLNLNNKNYNLRAPEYIVKELTSSYSLTDNYGRNNAQINGINYSNTTVLNGIIRKARLNSDNVIDTIWKPSISDYDPDISCEEYIKCIKEININWQDTLYYMYLLGGSASCKEISDRYGDTPQHYNSNAINIAKKIQEITDCEIYDAADYGGYWTILFYGRNTNGNEVGKFKWTFREPLEDAMRELVEEGWFDMFEKSEIYNNVLYPMNTILYGPPGTGKTYSSILYAVGICDDKPIEELKDEDYGEVLSRFNELRTEGRIAFTTFHQSYGYEEFIEGIKPVVDDDGDENENISYSIEDGLFKRFCTQAVLPSQATSSSKNYGLNKNPSVWKVSLEGTGDNPTRTECLENSHIRIGWDGYGEVITDDTDFYNGGRIVLNSFINKMKVGDVVLSCYSASTVDAVGVVTGEYEWHSEYSSYKRLRKVKWLAKNINYNIVELNGGTSMTLATVYKMKLTITDVFKILEDVGVSSDTSAELSDKKYVFIIDEINRGNISKIFGELITLIEPSKRIGKAEELRLELPYSRKKFGVPDNVYILGTMNTADRSIALMDTALRRRFQFVEMMPDTEVLKDIIVEQDGETIDIAEMLKIINLRIEYLYDREHTIGHAYFMPLLNSPSIDTLAEIFDTNIIPLLKEYFYEDYGKIQMILGDNKKSSDDLKFVKETKLITKDIFNGDTSELDLPEQIYSIQKEALYNIRSYKEISKDL